MIVLALALVMEFAMGEPPVAIHFVVWMGKYLNGFGRLLPENPIEGFLAGALAWLIGAGFCLVAGIAISRGLRWVGWGAPLLEALFLWPMISIRMLFSEVSSVEKGLSVSLKEGRARLSRIVSRDTSELSESEVRQSALESLSENLCDSVIAPLFWWALFGLPGVFVYRFANTADASWGYRGEWEHKGKWAAHADDLLNWIPARLTALFLGGFRHWSRLLEESRLTPSPNGGWSMGALALTLGIRLGKPGVYVLNASGREPTADDTGAALLRCGVAVAVGAVFSGFLRRYGW